MGNKYQEVYERIKANKAMLPAMPDVGLKILAALDNPHGNTKMFAKIIESDMGLSAFIIKTSRSLRFLTRIPPKNVERAVAVMGRREAYHLSLAFLSRALFHSSNPSVKRHMNEAYKFSTKVAVMSYFLAAKVPGIAPSDAMLAGLFQDIGVPAILAALDSFPDILNDDKLRKECVDELAPIIGAMIMKQWALDEKMNVVKSRKTWQYESETADLDGLVLIARVHAMIGTPDFKDCPALDEIPAFHRFNFGEMGPDNTLQLLIDSKEELNEMQTLLSA